MSLPILTALFISTASAGASLDTTLTLPSSMDVYVADTLSVRVKNTGNRNATNVELISPLPETNTSPTVYVMGDLGSFSNKCVESGTERVCNLGRIKKNKSKTVTFDIALPWSFDTLDFVAIAEGSNTASDSDSDSACVIDEDTVISGANDITNQHCTGTGLVAYYECTLFPDSISSHTATLESDGTVSFASAPGYGGTWGQDSDDSLSFEYTYGGSYVAPYEVCLD